MARSIRDFLGINAYGEKEDGTKMSHEEQYERIVNVIGLQSLIELIPATQQQINEALEEDEHLNNIPLKKWDAQHGKVVNRLIRVGINSISQSNTVCILKCAAKMWAKQID